MSVFVCESRTVGFQYGVVGQVDVTISMSCRFLCVGLDYSFFDVCFGRGDQVEFLLGVHPGFILDPA